MYKNLRPTFKNRNLKGERNGRKDKKYEKKMPINSYFLKEADCWPGNFFFGVAQHGAEKLSSVSISDATAFHYTHYPHICARAHTHTHTHRILYYL
jgi:hypothetical protein